MESLNDTEKKKVIYKVNNQMYTICQLYGCGPALTQYEASHKISAFSLQYYIILLDKIISM